MLLLFFIAAAAINNLLKRCVINLGLIQSFQANSICISVLSLVTIKLIFV